MISGANIDENTQKFFEIIQKPHSDENTAILINLIQAGIHIEKQGQYCRTPLHWAVIFGNTEIVRLLLDNRADTEAKDITKKTPLHWAVIQKRPEIIQLLLKNGANIEAKDNLGKTPLHRAIYLHQNFQFLLDNGADIEAKDNSGRTPLQFVSTRFNPNIFEKLITDLIDKIDDFGRFDCLREDFYLNFLKKTLNADSENWEQKLADAAKEESIDTPVNMINKIFSYMQKEDKLQIIKIIERQYTNGRTLAKAYSLTGGLLLPNIVDRPCTSARIRILDNGPTSICSSSSSSSSLIDDALTPSPTLFLSGNHHQANAASAVSDDNEDSNDDALTNRISKTASI
ncbi:ankyrin repeat domain-containing protein [Candidatus Berkiella aquae]|uniref:Ankyrin repeat domain-containing protein n=1 Tax=Candidatus Berkiella aquae TaxID=295108 RepID=A0A0Q9YTS6_9GAMM|nr:ankyrin repeat domain-containing protein [Candidatus Berkiella aquae]MCS5711210.1 ankyrin repeat domain-containing protein [Candidatus Berkiella aquae]